MKRLLGKIARKKKDYSSTPFPGANKYVYYYKHSTNYYYAEEPVSKKQKWTAIQIFAITASVLILLISSVNNVVNIRTFSGALPMNYSHQEIIIDDPTGVIENADALRERLAEFQAETGITPVVMSEARGELAYEYYNTEKREERFKFYKSDFIRNDLSNAIASYFTYHAYEKFLKDYDDQSHMVFCYVPPDGDALYPASYDIIFGADCDLILHHQADNMIEMLDEHISKGDSVDTAVMKVLDMVDPAIGERIVQRKYRITKEGIKKKNILLSKRDIIEYVLVPQLLFLGFAILVIVKLRKPSEKLIAMQNAVQIPEDAKLETCAWCNGKYVVNTTNGKCPYCYSTISESTDNFGGKNMYFDQIEVGNGSIL